MSWPLDIGDDPAFESSQKFADDGGGLSWGVCRPDLRNQVLPGDLMVFFAADRLSDRVPARYFFVAYATIAHKVSQQAIWEEERLGVYRRYRNLLMRPAVVGYQHYEPQMAKSLWHRDWLWRMTNHRGARKRDLESLEQTEAWNPGDRVNGRPLRIAANYVLFAPEGDTTFVAANPPIVAEAASNGASETWGKTDLAKELRHLTVLGSATSRTGLRTTNRQTAHMFIKLAARPSQIRTRLDDLLQRHGITSRAPPSRTAGDDRRTDYGVR